MKLFSICFLNALLISLAVSNTTQGQLMVDAQLRSRFEFRDGYQNLLPDKAIPAAFVSQRTRLSFYYANERFRIKITPQDVRIWGDEELASPTGVFGDRASLDLFEGFAEIRAGSNAWFSIGRQQLIYDNERMLSKRNWNQLGIAYDAVVAKINLNEWNLHIAGSWNALKETGSENLYRADRIKSLNFIWLNREIAEKISASLIHIASGVTQADTVNKINFRQTTGAYSKFKKNKLSIWGDAYYQYGKNREGAQVSAFLAGADASYDIGWIITGIGFEYLSGNSRTGDDRKTDNLFDLLYGARHRYLGYMDYFRNIPVHTSEGGLVDYYFYLEFRAAKSVSIRNQGHYFQLAQTNPTTPDDRNLGYENDLVVKYKFSEWGSLEGGYMFLLPAESLQKIQNVPDAEFAQFAYLQLTLTPILFQQKEHH